MDSRLIGSSDLRRVLEYSRLMGAMGVVARTVAMSTQFIAPAFNSMVEDLWRNRV